MMWRWIEIDRRERFVRANPPPSYRNRKITYAYPIRYHEHIGHDHDYDHDYDWPAVAFLLCVRAWNPALIAETVLDAPHC